MTIVDPLHILFYFIVFCSQQYMSAKSQILRVNLKFYTSKFSDYKTTVLIKN